MRRLVLLAIALSGLAACGGDDAADPAPRREPAPPRSVAGSVELDRPPAAPADAGTVGGHRGPDAVASTAGSSLTVRGSIDPPHSAVTIHDRDTGRRAAAEVVAGGRFTARASGLRRGPNEFVIEGRARGYRPWTIDVTITRR